jgi:hypothetical protein
LAYLLFTAYFLFFCLLVHKLPFFKKSGLGTAWLLALFCIKVLCSILYGYVYSRPQYIATADTWQIYFASMEEYRLLQDDPAVFFYTWFGNPNHLQYGNFFESKLSYWNNFKDLLLIKCEALLNLFTGGRYYCNAVIYSFITFAGVVMFYKTVRRLTGGNRLLLVCACFLLPSFLFWTGGMYKDGLLFLFLSLITYQMSLWFEDKKLKRLFYMLGAVVFIFLLRAYVAMLIVPALTAWFISSAFPSRSFLIYTATYAVCLIVVFFSTLIHPSLDIPKLISSWQHAFLRLPSRSSLAASPLEPTVYGMIKNLPQAVNKGFFRPYIWEFKGWQNIPHAIEIFAYLCLLLNFIFRKKTQNREQILFLYFCIFLTFSSWLLIGYTVHIAGALVRYKSIFLPLLMAPLIRYIPVRGKTY